MKQKKYPPCPDGGWGWVVVFGSFMIHVIADGIIYSFGLFYYEFAKHFGASKTATSMVVSIMNGTTLCIGPIASALTIRFGCRTVTIAGAMFASLGFFCSTFTTNIYMLYWTIGICAGFGFGLMYLPAIVIVTSYFEKKRAFATGIAVCGSGIGTAIMSPLIEYIIQLYGWKGAILVISALLLNCAIFGALFKPVPSATTTTTTTTTMIELNDDSKRSSRTMSKQERKFLIAFPVPHRDQLSTKSSVEINVEPPPTPPPTLTDGSRGEPPTNPEEEEEEEYEPPKPRSHSFSPGFYLREDSFYSGSLMNISNHHHFQQEDNHQDSTDTTTATTTMDAAAGTTEKPKDCFLFKRCNCPVEIRETVAEMIDFSLMKNHIFLLFSVSNFLTSVGYYIPYIYLKDWIVDMKIGSPQETGKFTSIIGIFSTVSRLVFGYLSDQPFVNRLWIYMISVTICGLIIVSNTLATTYALLAIFCALYGLTCGTYVSLTSVVLVDLLSLEKLTNAFGLILLCQGLASIIGPLFIGFIYDLSGTYNTGFHIIGSLVAFSGIMLVAIPLSHHFNKSVKKIIFYS